MHMWQLIACCGQLVAIITDTISLCSISERQELRKRLQCKSFQWFLDNVYPQFEWVIYPLLLLAYHTCSLIPVIQGSPKARLYLWSTALSGQWSLYKCCEVVCRTAGGYEGLCPPRQVNKRPGQLYMYLYEITAVLYHNVRLSDGWQVLCGKVSSTHWNLFT